MSDAFLDALASAIKVREFVGQYYDRRELKRPSKMQGAAFLDTEIAEAEELVIALVLMRSHLREVWEQLLAEEGGWVRNNDGHLPYAPELLGKELGDIIQMCFAVGEAAGVNPLEAMVRKMQSKLEG